MIISRFRKLHMCLKRLQGRWLRKDFPRTSERLEAFITSTLILGGFNAEDSGYRSLVAQSILHSTQGQRYLYPNLIALEIRRAEANAWAFQIIEAIKKKEKKTNEA